MRRFRQLAFIHADLPFALFPLSALGARGCFFEFYHEIGLQCGSMFLPFSLTDGLYLAKLYTLSLDDFSPCDDFTFDTTVLVAQTRSTALVLPDVAALPIPRESSTSLLQASSIVSPAPVFTIPEPSDSFSSRLTGAGLLLLHAHRRLGHLHDRPLKWMIDFGMCGNLVWVPGIVIRAHCWNSSYLKGKKKRNAPSPDPNLRDLHPLSCQDFVWDWCVPHHHDVRALHSELYWFLAVGPSGYHWGAIAEKKSNFCHYPEFSSAPYSR